MVRRTLILFHFQIIRARRRAADIAVARQGEVDKGMDDLEMELLDECRMLGG